MADGNVIVLSQIEEDKRQIFELAKIYKNFSENIENEKKNKHKDDKNNQTYMISREYIDNFKEFIKYEEIKEYLKDSDNDTNFHKFKEKLKDKTLDELEYILCADIKLYCCLSEIQEDFTKGFDFINYCFLNKLDFDENFEDYIVQLNKKENVTLVQFNDKSKLLIEEENGKYKYHVMEAPIINVDSIPKIKRTKTIAFFSNRRSKARKVILTTTKTMH